MRGEKGGERGASQTDSVLFRLVAAIYTGDLSPFHNGNNFWMIPFLVPYLGSVIAVCVYSFFIERLSGTKKSKSVIAGDIKFIGS